ncbi:hypothetical protein NC653_005192 [Populus alba x Populus x berolinensis]|uniref:Uncharacterized protein n=1 Tax=Populus alba x Populus x berolinensis TaxID=444605 RepID=A0AAD6RCL0_9ROSI|nr:hypothetical protein NC653_005192 [Populus alba x Populus x berolinensis]
MICGSTGKKLLAKARMILISSVTLPEEKLGAVPNGLSTDSDVAKRFAPYPSLFFCLPFFLK